MRGIIIITCILFVFLNINHAKAQRYLPGQQGVQITGSIADRAIRNPKNNTAYAFGAAIATYTKTADRWVIGGEYFTKDYTYKDIKIPVSWFTGEGGYYLKFLSDRNKTFFLSLGLSAVAGYETSNWGEKLLYDGAYILNKDSFIYGGALTMELETYLTDQLVLLINAREKALWGSSIGRYHTQIGLGLKVMIN